jgi:hypothetical protein
VPPVIPQKILEFSAPVQGRLATSGNIRGLSDHRDIFTVLAKHVVVGQHRCRSSSLTTRTPAVRIGTQTPLLLMFSAWMKRRVLRDMPVERNLCATWPRVIAAPVSMCKSSIGRMCCGKIQPCWWLQHRSCTGSCVESVRIVSRGSQQRRDQIDRQWEHDRRTLFVGDIRERLQVTQLQRRGLARQ